MYLPDANTLILVSQMLASGEIERLDGANVVAEMVLGATVRGQIGVVARVLGHLHANNINIIIPMSKKLVYPI